MGAEDRWQDGDRVDGPGLNEWAGQILAATAALVAADAADPGTALGAHLDATYAPGEVADAAPSPLLAPNPSVPAATITDEGGAAYPGWMSADGTTLFNIQYAALRWSIDGGTSWGTHAHAFAYGITAVRDMGNGEIVVAIGGGAGQVGELWRSTGWAANPATATFAKVLTASAADVYFHNSWSLFAHENIVLAGEYGPKVAGANARYVYLSTDHGATWSTIYDIGATADTHVHGVAWDRWWGRIWISHGDVTNGVYYSDDLGATWAEAAYTSTEKCQVTTIFPMRDCVLFLSDSAPNGVLRAPRLAKNATVKIEPAYRFNATATITHIGQTAYQARIPGAPVLLAFTNDNSAGYTGPGVLLATVDGYRFWELWRDTIDYGAFGGLSTAVGPTILGKYLGVVIDGRYTNYSRLTLTAPAWGVDTVVRDLPPKSGRYYAAVAGAVSTVSAGNSVLFATPQPVTRACTIDRIGIGVTTAGNAGSLVRLGIYADDGGMPGALILDAGTVDAATTGIKELTVSVRLSPGVYWLAAAAQSAASTAPVVRSNNGSVGVMIGAESNVIASLGVPGLQVGGGAVGAFPVAFGAGVAAGAVPRVIIRIA